MPFHPERAVWARHLLRGLDALLQVTSNSFLSVAFSPRPHCCNEQQQQQQQNIEKDVLLDLVDNIISRCKNPRKALRLTFKKYFWLKGPVAVSHGKLPFITHPQISVSWAEGFGNV